MRLLATGLACAILIGLFVWAGNTWAGAQARHRAAAAAQTAAATRASLLVSELQTYRLMPVVLSERPDLRAALAHPDRAASVAVDSKLESLAGLIGAPIIYLLDARGHTIAASNWREPSSFVGQDYSFRPYFTRAWRDGSAEFFGMGTVSRQSGLFLSRRIGAAGPGGGVVVVKFGFDAVERGWGPPPDIVYVTDADGVIVLTNRPGWRFRTTRPLEPGRRDEMRRIRQFGDAPLLPLAVGAEEAGMVSLPGRFGQRVLYGVGRLPVPVPGWRLTVLEPVAPIRATFLATARLVVATAAIALVVAALLWLRGRERAELAIASRLELERQVRLRTAELEAAQTRFREAREELAHANRLGSIGQITATVAHEINQPVGAIRAFAENGIEFLRRGDDETTRDNLERIAALTARIGAITAELRGYARRGSGAVRPTGLDEAIDGALLLVGHQLRGGAISLARDGERGLSVRADRVRLEQILVNLFHNAVEALAATPRPVIRIATRADGDTVRLLFADNGPGIAADIQDQLFTPFATSKPGGLGLGLGIARDIAREFGGELDAMPSPGDGALFQLTLRQA